MNRRTLIIGVKSDCPDCRDLLELLQELGIIGPVYEIGTAMQTWLKSNVTEVRVIYIDRGGKMPEGTTEDWGGSVPRLVQVEWETQTISAIHDPETRDPKNVCTFLGIPPEVLSETL